MVKPQYPYEDEHGVKHDNLVKHYSDLNLKIRKVGTDEVYDYAVDTYPTDYRYVETDESITPQEAKYEN